MDSRKKWIGLNCKMADVTTMYKIEMIALV